MHGYSDGTFRPEEEITRQAMAVMMARAIAFAGGKTVSRPATPLEGYSDSGDISSWAKDGLTAAMAAGLLEGMGDGRLAPDAPATRAQGAVMLKRLLQYVGFIDAPESTE